jgi:glycosyltransferase involved in cell wall biosynthesis
MLERFYTDFCISAASASVLRRLVASRWRLPALDNVLNRTLPAALPRRRVKTFLPTQLLRRQSSEANAFLRARVAADRFRGGNAIYCINNAELELATQAKRDGLVVVVDQVLTPDVGLILIEERARFAGIEGQDSDELIYGGIERDKALWAVADLVLAPADYTRDAIVRLGGDPAKIRVVPYGVGDDWLDAKPAPERGRVLFVGSVGLRKGTHYLAHAARLLKERGVQCEIVVVGPYDPSAVARPEFQGPTYLGRIPRSRVREEFLRADVFVHPSLAEGCAVASLEALACGLPMVVTPNAGTVVRDGVDGFIVPACDGPALAEKLEMIVTDRVMRTRMSARAAERARDYSWDAYERRLVAALRELPIPKLG